VDLSIINHTALTHCMMLFLGTFLQEDLAVVTGGMFIIKKELPWILALVSLYSGIVISDFLIYGLGVAARSIPWTQKYLLNDKVQFAKKKIEKNVIPSVAFCRLLPGLLFPTFLACGWLGISFFQFALTTLIAAALYAVILLFLITTIGATFIQPVGTVGWIILFSIAIILVLFKTFRSSIPKTDKLNSSKNNTISTVPSTLALSGMPTFSWKTTKVALAEKIPPILFYLPVAIQWILLGIYHRSITLPTAANPFIEAGGLWGESKSELLNQIAPKFQNWVASFVTIIRSAQNSDDDYALAITKIDQAGITFPLVVKPDIGWQGYGVRLLQSDTELRSYIASYPLNRTIIIQKYVPFFGEAGVFYVRIPGQEKGYIPSLTFRYFPYIEGDGHSTIKELIDQDERTKYKSKFYFGGDGRHSGIDPSMLQNVPKLGEKIRLAFIGSLRVGGTYRDGSRFITPELTERCDQIARSMPPFHFGRFDIRFDSIEKLQKGDDFSIIEINGAGSEAIHIWDIDNSLRHVYKELFSYQSLLFKIASINRKNGIKHMGLINFLKYSANYNKLLQSYPTSE
jgi:membrane protein DedA with SNARE-associated domain